MINLQQVITGLIKDDVEKLCINILNDLVQQTPVDTGAARANWVVSIGSPNSASSLTQTDYSSSRTEGERTIMAAPVFKNIYIQNNLPYIRRLNDGWSLQAPSKYVDRIVTGRAAEDR